MRYIDIRSDTVTQPTQKMRDAMYTAVVGDDVNRDDPTMLELEELAAKLVGKEAAMFVPSGTMGNQVSIMTHTRRGDEVICGELSHIVIHEVGAPAVLSGVDVVVFGHSHKYVQEEKGGVLWLNPGSCGPRRFHQEITMMTAEAEDGKIRVEKVIIPHGTA